jgi:hypothetical protein
MAVAAVELDMRYPVLMAQRAGPLAGSCSTEALFFGPGAGGAAYRETDGP